MKISRKVLGRMVAEEVRRRLRELHEFKVADDEDGKPSKKGKRPDTASADSEQPRKGPTPIGAKGDGRSPDVSAPTKDTPEVDQEDDPSGPAVDGSQPDPEAQDDAAEDEQDAIDPEGDEGSEPSGAVNDEISGKTVQAITIEPKSKVLPGAKEVVLAFNESTDTLRILVTSTGSVKFFWRGQLHDLP